MSDETRVYRLDWHAGPGAQIEIFSPGSGSGSLYQVKYIPPMRTAIRPPVEKRPLGPVELKPIDDMLNLFVASSLITSGRGTVSPVATDPADPDPELADLGGLLFDLIVPKYVQADLRPEGVFLEFGMDEDLLGYPWELMHDGTDFVCMKHAFGRFVNGSKVVTSDFNPEGSWDTTPQKISVLLISVSKPLPQDGVEYEPIPQVDVEANNIAESLTESDVQVEWLRDEKATFTKVVQKLRKTHYHIVHFCGHAHTDGNEPRHSSLVLHDKSLTTGTIVVTVGKNRPSLCFINACESASDPAGKDRFNVYGLASAFLETGAYLIGSRWKIGDKAASVFAPNFYTSLFGHGKPLGVAVREARQVCRKEQPHDFAWASYVFYGDPRVCFKVASTKPS